MWILLPLAALDQAREDQNAINAEISEIHLDWNGESGGAVGRHCPPGTVSA